MKTVSLFLLLAVLSLLISSCATDPADKAFFERGWRHPGDNDSHLGR